MTHLEILLKAYDDIGIQYQVEKKVYDDDAYTYVRFRGDNGSVSSSFIEFYLMVVLPLIKRMLRCQ